MLTRSLGLLLVSVLASTAPVAAQQPICPVAGARPFHAAGSIGRSFRSDGEAQDIVSSIKVALNISDDIRACVSDSGEYPNAHALVGTGDKTRYIVFNRGWMSRLQSSTANYWSLIGIAAHEVGHHGARHELTPFEHNCRLNHRIELQADYFSGFALGNLGAKQDDATSSMREMPLVGGCTHPPRQARIAMVTEGWQDSKAVSVASGQATDTTEKSATARGRGATTGQSVDEREREEDRTKLAPDAQSRTTAPVSTLASGAERALARVQTDYSAASRQFRYRHNRDVYGRDIARVIGITLDACADACLKTNGCKGFSFDRWNGWCFLKDAMPGSVLDPASTIGVRRGIDFPLVDKIEHEMLDLRRRKFSDTPLRVIANKNFEACREICDEELSCVAFTAVRKDKSCRLFRQTEGHFADEAYDSGFKRQLPKPTAGNKSGSGIVLAQQSGAGFAGTGYDRHEDASYADCEVLCRRDTRCRSLEYVGKTKVCRLYSDVPARRPAAGSVIAIKSGA